MIFLVQTLIGQSFIKQVENLYNSLDSVSYIENTILSYREDLLERFKGDTVLLYREDLIKQKVWEEIDAAYMKSIAASYLNIDDSIKRNNTIDNISKEHNEIIKSRYYSMFISNIKDNPIHYVLNLRIDSCCLSNKQIYLFPDTSKMPFNLFCFGNNYKGGIYVYFENGQYSWSDSHYVTFSRQFGKNATKVFRKIMQKKPRYLLYCSELEGMNTIMYVLNNKIYVYRIVQMKEYVLDDYFNKFMR